jgi:hypothetical protein
MKDKFCSCFNIRETGSFKNSQDYFNFEKELLQNPKFEEVKVEKLKNNVGFFERWYKCNKCGTVWRLVEPDSPYKGIWEQV